MISTLIRSRDNIITPTPIGTSEYLVDTETNRVIYPKTRLEDIIGLEELELPPSSIGGGIDPTSYVTETKDLTGFTILSQTTVKFPDFNYSIPSDGIYAYRLYFRATEINRECTVSSSSNMSAFTLKDENMTRFPLVPGKFIYASVSLSGIKVFSKGYKFETLIYLQFKEQCRLLDGTLKLEIIKLCGLANNTR